MTTQAIDRPMIQGGRHRALAGTPLQEEKSPGLFPAFCALAARATAYFSRSEMDLDTWRRLEFRNEYQEPRDPRLMDIHRRY